MAEPRPAAWRCASATVNSADEGLCAGSGLHGAATYQKSGCAGNAYTWVLGSIPVPPPERRAEEAACSSRSALATSRSGTGAGTLKVCDLHAFLISISAAKASRKLDDTAWDLAGDLPSQADHLAGWEAGKARRSNNHPASGGNAIAQHTGANPK
jgi:hypothetical protein